MKAEGDYKLGKRAYFMSRRGKAARKSGDLPTGMNHA
jgi:hypothetical protein